MPLYQIYNPNTKQYSKGTLPGVTGRIPFTKFGKVWASKGAFSNHLTAVGDVIKYYKECQVIVIDVDAEKVTRHEFLDWHAEYTANKKSK